MYKDLLKILFLIIIFYKLCKKRLIKYLKKNTNHFDIMTLLSQTKTTFHTKTIYLLLDNHIKSKYSTILNNFGYFYLIKPRASINNNSDIYKIGITEQMNPKTRLSGYTKGYKILLLTKIYDVKLFEKKIIDNLNLKFQQCPDYGNEYFEGDLSLIIDKIKEVLKINFGESFDNFIINTDKTEILKLYNNKLNYEQRMEIVDIIDFNNNKIINNFLDIKIKKIKHKVIKNVIKNEKYKELDKLYDQHKIKCSRKTIFNRCKVLNFNLKDLYNDKKMLDIVISDIKFQRHILYLKRTLSEEQFHKINLMYNKFNKKINQDDFKKIDYIDYIEKLLNIKRFEIEKINILNTYSDILNLNDTDLNTIDNIQKFFKIKSVKIVKKLDLYRLLILIYKNTFGRDFVKSKHFVFRVNGKCKKIINYNINYKL